MIKTIRAWLKKENKSTLEQWIEIAVKILPLVFLIRTFIFGLYVVPSGSMETTMLVGERFYADKLTPWFTKIKRGEIISLNDPTFKYSKNVAANLFERYVWGPSNWTKRVIGIPGDHVKGVVEDGKPIIYLNGTKLEEPYVNKYPLIYLWKRSVPTVQDLYLGHYAFDVRSFDPAKPYHEQLFYRVNPQLIISNTSELRPQHATYNDALGCYLQYPATPMADGADVFDVQLGPDEFWLMGDNRLGSRDSRDWGKLDGRLIHGRIIFCFASMEYAKPWSWLIFDESWWIIDLVMHPVSFWGRIRWSRCFTWIQ